MSKKTDERLDFFDRKAGREDPFAKQKSRRAFCRRGSLITDMIYFF